MSSVCRSCGEDHREDVVCFQCFRRLQEDYECELAKNKEAIKELTCRLVNLNNHFIALQEAYNQPAAKFARGEYRDDAKANT